MGRGWVQSFSNDTSLGPQLSLLRAKALEGTALSWSFQYEGRLGPIQKTHLSTPSQAPGGETETAQCAVLSQEGTFLLPPLKENEGKVPWCEIPLLGWDLLPSEAWPPIPGTETSGKQS